MKHKHIDTFIVSGVGQSILDSDGITIPLAGEARMYGLSREAVVYLKIPNSLVAVFSRMLDKPVEQIPLYRPELIRLNLQSK